MSLPLAEVNYVEATWVMVVKSIVIFLGVFMIVPLLTVVERKLIGRFQNRYGPNRVGPVGLVQPLADIVKLAGKEMFRPDAAVPFLYAIAPAIVIFSGIITLAILPFGNVQDGIGLYGIDVSIGVLYFFAFSSISFYGLLLAGWSSGSKYSFLGAMRSAAQLISLRGLDGTGAARRGPDDRVAVADERRRCAGLDLEHRPPDRRLPDLHGRRASPRPTGPRSTCRRPTPSSSRAT